MYNSSVDLLHTLITFLSHTLTDTNRKIRWDCVLVVVFVQVFYELP